MPEIKKCDSCEIWPWWIRHGPSNMKLCYVCYQVQIRSKSAMVQVREYLKIKNRDNVFRDSVGRYIQFVKDSYKIDLVIDERPGKQRISGILQHVAENY